MRIRRALVLDAGSRCSSALFTPHASWLLQGDAGLFHAHKCTYWMPIRSAPRGDVPRTGRCECSAGSPHFRNAVIVQTISFQTNDGTSSAFPLTDTLRYVILVLQLSLPRLLRLCLSSKEIQFHSPAMSLLELDGER